MKVALSSQITAQLSCQSYAPQPDIQGVFYKPLKKFRALEGSFMEYLRLSNQHIEGLPIAFDARQISFSQAIAGRINAFHIHHKEIQDELWSVLAGTLLVWLVDIREGSPTKNNKRRICLNAEEPGLLYIPSGVAHGYKAGPEGAMLVYTMNSQFNIQDPNEGRLPYDIFGKELWEEDRG